MPLRSKKIVSKNFTFELNLPFSVLALRNASIGIIGLWFQCLSRTLMIRHHLWPFWVNLDRIVVNISRAMFMRRCFWSRFSNFGTIFVAIHFTTIWQHHQQHLGFDDYSNLLHCFNVFNGCWRARAIRTSINMNIFSTLFKPVIVDSHNTANITNVLWTFNFVLFE